MPSWLTEAAARASRAARSGAPGLASAQPSMKICAPICSAIALPFSAIEPLAGAACPWCKRSQAVCSVERLMPPHHRMVLSSMM